jgi:acetyl esterase/lipase
MAITTRTAVVLEPASQAFVDETSTPPFLYELTPAEARKVLEDVQAAPIDKLPVEDHWVTVPAEVGEVDVRIEADVLRDEGEAYAARLRAAGVPITTVRYDGITHDFMMLNPLSATHARRAAVAQAISVLRDALWSA